MSLVGFRAKNHPQQVKVRGAVDRDNLGTDPALFASLSAMYGPFTLDAAATDENAKAPRYFTPESDGLRSSWRNESVWCNPPYSQIAVWVQKAWREHPWTRLIVMLVPANRTEQSWWQKDVEPYRDRRECLRVDFLPGRPRFVLPGNAEIGPNERPPFGCALLIWPPNRLHACSYPMKALRAQG